MPDKSYEQDRTSLSGLSPLVRKTTAQVSIEIWTVAPMKVLVEA